MIFTKFFSKVILFCFSNVQNLNIEQTRKIFIFYRTILKNEKAQPKSPSPEHELPKIISSYHFFEIPTCECRYSSVTSEHCNR